MLLVALRVSRNRGHSRECALDICHSANNRCGVRTVRREKCGHAWARTERNRINWVVAWAWFCAMVLLAASLVDACARRRSGLRAGRQAGRQAALSFSVEGQASAVSERVERRQSAKPVARFSLSPWAGGALCFPSLVCADPLPPIMTANLGKSSHATRLLRSSGRTGCRG